MRAPGRTPAGGLRRSRRRFTMGCGDACPVFPGKRYEDWKLDDPAGRGVEAVSPTRDEIGERVRALVSDLPPVPG